MTTGSPSPKFLPYTPLNTARFSPKYLYGLFGSEIVCLAVVLACLVTIPRLKFHQRQRTTIQYQPGGSFVIEFSVARNVRCSCKSNLGNSRQF